MSICCCRKKPSSDAVDKDSVVVAVANISILGNNYPTRESVTESVIDRKEKERFGNNDNNNNNNSPGLESHAEEEQDSEGVDVVDSAFTVRGDFCVKPLSKGGLSTFTGFIGHSFRQ